MLSRRRERKFTIPDDYAIVLDYMPTGNPVDRHPQHRVRAIAQAIGTKFFTLVEFYPKRGVDLQIGEEVFIGLHGVRDKVEYVFNERLMYADLTSVAKANLPEVVRKLVLRNEKIFVEFFNRAGPITIRFHAFELLPGIGKKSMWLVLEERKKSPFKSFEDIQNRVKINDPVKVIVDRILLELRGEEKYYIFIEPPPNAPPNAIALRYLERLYKILSI